MRNSNALQMQRPIGDVFVNPTLCSCADTLTTRKYNLVRIDDISRATPVDCLVFDISFAALAECLEIQSHTLVHIEYFKYATQNEVPPFRVGLNLFPNLTLYTVVLTGFGRNRKSKNLHRSIAAGLGAEICTQIRAVSDVEALSYRLAYPNAKFLFLVYNPYFLLALLRYLSVGAQEALFYRVFSPQVLASLSDRLLTRYQTSDIIVYAAIDTIHALKISTFKLPTAEMSCIFNKVDFVKDAPAQSVSNLLSGKCFMSIVSLDPRFYKYMNLAMSTHYIWGKIAIAKAAEYVDVDSARHRYFAFTNEQLRSLVLSELSLALTYSRPIVLIVSSDFQLAFPAETPYAAQVLRSCTVIPLEVLTEQNMHTLQVFKEKIIILCAAPDDIDETFRQEFTVMSYFWFRCLQAEQIGAVVKSTKPFSQAFPPDKVFANTVVYTPNVLNFLSNSVLQALSHGNFVAPREELPIAPDDVLYQVFEVLPALLRPALQAQLEQQLQFAKKRDQSIGIYQLFQHLVNGVDVQRAVENSRGFEQNYISGYMDSYYSGANLSRVEDAKDELMVDLDDEVFTVERSAK